MEKERYRQIFDNENRHWWYQGRKKLLVNLLTKVKLKKGAKILDYGCGTGYLMPTLSEFGRTYGLDNSPEAVKYCLYKGLKRVRLLKTAKIPYTAGDFDLITVLDVLEHIENDTYTLKQLARILKPGGVIIIFAPVFPILWSKLDEITHHKRRYTDTELSRKIQGAGLKPKQQFYFNFILFLPILLIRLLTRLGIIPQCGFLPKTPPRIINWLSRAIFELDISLAPKIFPPFGVSMAVLARKSGPAV